MVEEATVPEAQLNQFPSTEAHINVEVVLRPKIDVYPASATLVKQVFIHLFLYCCYSSLRGRQVLFDAC